MIKTIRAFVALLGLLWWFSRRYKEAMNYVRT